MPAASGYPPRPALPPARTAAPTAPEPIPALRPTPPPAAGQTPLTAGLRRPQPKLPAAPAAPGTAMAPVPVGGSQPILLPGGQPTGQAGTATLSPHIPAATPTQGTPMGGAPPAVPATPTAGSPTTLTPTDPNNPLTAQTITPGALADRFAIAEQRWQQFADSTAPAYQAALRDANRMGAAQGRLGAGSLRTDFGNLANQRDLNLRTAQGGFLSDALEGSIDDAWRGIGLAERQQGFQAGQQTQAFGNELARMQIEEALRSGDFSRALQLWMAGNQGGTGANTALAGANTAGNNAQDAYAALQEWLRSRAALPGVPSGQTVLRPPTTLPPGSA